MTLKTRLTGTLAALGDTLAERFGSRRHTVALDLAETIARAGDGYRFAFSALICDETDALARLLAAYGLDRIGVDVLLRHSDGCRPDRVHGGIRDWATAEAYLNRLIGDRDTRARDAAEERTAPDGDIDLDLDEEARVRVRSRRGVPAGGEPDTENDCR